MKTTWRLTSELLAFFITGKSEVYLSALEKKQYIQDTKKLIGDKPYKEVRLYGNEFEIKFTGEYGGITVCAKSDEFPTSDWYTVCNFHSPSMWNLIKSHTIENGIIADDVKFEAIFSDDTPLVSFIEPEMEEFKGCMEEMRRRLNCELYKKTSNWIPGHRYDSLSETIIFLAKVKSRRATEFNSVFLENLSEMPEVYLYVNSIKDEDKTVDDVLRNRSFGNGDYDIKILYKKQLMCDSGEVLENNFTGEIQDYWLDLYNNSCEKVYRTRLNAFSLVSKETKIVHGDLIPRSDINSLLKSMITYILIERWNIKVSREDLRIGESLTQEENIEKLRKLYLISDRGISDPNFQKIIYYKNLFEYLGIDLNDVIKEALYEFQALDFENFDVFYKYIDYFKNKARFKSLSSNQRVKSTSYKLEVTYLKDLFGEKSELTNTLISLINTVNDSLGLGITGYTVINMGNRKEPNLAVRSVITLEDLIKFKKGVSNLSENLKNEIVRHKFVELNLEFDKDSEIL